MDLKMDDDSNLNERKTMLRFFTETGDELTNAPIVVPCELNLDKLQILCNQLLKTYNQSKNANDEEHEPVPITFRTNDGIEIIESLSASLGLERLCGEMVFI